MLEYLHWVLLVRLVQLALVYLEVLEGLVVRLGLLDLLFQVFLEDQLVLLALLVPVFLEGLEDPVVQLAPLGPLFQVFLEDQLDLFHPLVY